jgi:hypothetical protein
MAGFLEQLYPWRGPAPGDVQKMTCCSQRNSASADYWDIAERWNGVQETVNLDYRKFDCLTDIIGGKTKNIVWMLGSCVLRGLRVFQILAHLDFGFWLVLGFELGLVLARQVLYHCSQVPQPFFAFIIFQIGSCFLFWLAWTGILPFMLPL